jgi:hypothetical protein
VRVRSKKTPSLCTVPSLSDSVSKVVLCGELMMSLHCTWSDRISARCKLTQAGRYCTWSDTNKDSSFRRDKNSQSSLHHHSGDLRGDADQNHWKTGTCAQTPAKPMQEHPNTGSLVPASTAETRSCYFSQLTATQLLVESKTSFS